MRSGSAIVLTGKGYKEHHWLVVPPINHFGYFPIHSTTASLYHANVRSYYSRNSRPIRLGSCRRSCPGSDRQPHQRREGYHPLHVQQRRLPCKSPFEAHHSSCIDRVFSTLTMRRVGNILQLTTSIVVPTPMIQTRMGSKTSTAGTLSTPSATWPATSLPVTT